jgi:hypothetical protein
MVNISIDKVHSFLIIIMFYQSPLSKWEEDSPCEPCPEILKKSPLIRPSVILKGSLSRKASAARAGQPECRDGTGCERIVGCWSTALLVNYS